MTEKVKRYLYSELEYGKKSEQLKKLIEKGKISIPGPRDRYTEEHLFIMMTFKYNKYVYERFDEIFSINSNYSDIEKNIIKELYEEIIPITRNESERKFLYLIINKKCGLIKQQ